MRTLIGDVPGDWRVMPLHEACEVTAGPSGKQIGAADHVEPGVRLIAPKDIGDGRFVDGEADFVSPETAERLGKFRLSDRDIVGVRTASIGRYALVRPEHTGWLFNTACLRIRPGEVVLPGYLLHYLRHPVIRDWVEQNSLTSTIASINSETLRNLPLVLPPLTVQESIHGTLGALDDKVAVHEEISRRTARLREELSPFLLTGRLPDGRHDRAGAGG